MNIKIPLSEKRHLLYLMLIETDTTKIIKMGRCVLGRINQRLKETQKDNFNSNVRILALSTDKPLLESMNFGEIKLAERYLYKRLIKHYSFYSSLQKERGHTEKFICPITESDYQIKAIFAEIITDWKIQKCNSKDNLILWENLLDDLEKGFSNVQIAI